MEDVSGILRRRETRLLTLTGPGGVGKTRLALEVVRRVADDFPDGAAFVALAPLGEADLVATTISRTLGLREAGDRSARDTLHAYLSGRELLLVLDNFEHVMGAALEVAGLLGSCLGLHVLVTSRAPLRLRGEREWRVPPLAIPDPSHAPDVESVHGAPAARLFLDHAREASSTFLLTRKNAAAVAAICWRLDGLPLALELAAAQARFLGPTELLSRLDQALEAGGPGICPRGRGRYTRPWTGVTTCSPKRSRFCSNACPSSQAAFCWRQRRPQARAEKSASRTCSGCLVGWWNSRS